MARLLPYEIYYENSAGRVLRLDELPFVTVGGDIFDSAWRLTRAQRPLGEGGGLLGRKRPCTDRTLTVRVAAADPAGLSAALSQLADCFDTDVENGCSGRLWINGSYLSCWGVGRHKELSGDFPSTATVKLTVCPELPAWCTERLFRFPAGSGGTDSGGHNYPYAYPRRYGGTHRFFAISNTHFSPSPMRVTFYGPNETPRVYIAGECVGADVRLMEGEYLVIDQQKRLVTKTAADGTRQSCFGERIKNGKTFEYAPAGSSMVELYGDAGVDIVVIEQRSEPVWTYD